MTTRRLFCAFVSACVLPVRAQPRPVPARIGYMALPISTPNVRLAAFRQSLRDLGYVEGKDVVIEYREAAGRYERLPAIADALARMNVDVIVADDGTPSVIAARNATRTIPIVFTVINDPLASGIVKALAHPGGNVTGLSLQSPETTAKRLQMLTEILPRVRRVAVLVNPGNESMNAWRQELPDAAKKLKVELVVEEARSMPEIETVFERAAERALDAMIVFDDAMFYAQAARIGSLATKARLPVMGGNSVIAEGGGLASYGADRLDLVRRSAILVDKILRGADPGTLPVEQALKFELVVNLKAARGIGVEIPPHVLLRADKVIE